MKIKKIILSAGVASILVATGLFADVNKEENNGSKAFNSVKESGMKAKKEANISAKDLVKKAYKYLGDKDAYSFTARIFNEDDLGLGKMMVFITHDYNVSVMGDDKLRIDMRGDIENKDIYMNKGRVSVLSADKKDYAQVNVSPKIAETVEDMEVKYGFVIPLMHLVYSDTDERMDENVTGYFMGTTEIDKKRCFHLAFPEKEWNVQYWITTDKDKPMIKRVVFEDKVTKGNPRSIISVKWAEDAPKEKVFKFTPPKGAVKAEILTTEESKKALEKMKKEQEAKNEKK